MQVLDPAIVQILVALLGGGIGVKLVEVVIDKARGSEARRREVDRIAKQLRDAQRREHLAIVWGRRLELLAVQHGVSPADMPVLDFKNHE